MSLFKKIDCRVVLMCFYEFFLKIFVTKVWTVPTNPEVYRNGAFMWRIRIINLDEWNHGKIN